MALLAESSLWSRSCDVTAQVYDRLHSCPDRVFTERVMRNVLCIPERLAARTASGDAKERAEYARSAIEALIILQTQLYLACECGLLSQPESDRLCFEAACLVHQLAPLSKPGADG